MTLALDRLPLAAPPLRDEEVVERVRSGELDLYEILMRRYNQRLFRVARSVLADDAEAEEVVQDAWVRAYEHLDQFDGRARFATWVTKIALYASFAASRRRRRLVALVDADGERPGADDLPPANRPSPEQEACACELRHALEHALEKLPEALRVAFVLRDVEGLTTAEAASALGISEAALKVRLHRARHALRDDLERRAGAAAGALWAFAGERCDRIVSGVLRRISVC
jgi:RNA polymerase sigma-70 factor (ECF subfamily)